MALESISSQFCEIQKAYAHEDDAYIALYLYGGVLVFDFLYQYKKKKQILWGLILTSVLASAAIFMSGHSGAELVYEYGAAVKNSTTSCQ